MSRSVRSPLSPAQARELFAYNRRVFERFARRVRRMPWREVRRRREIGHQSLFDTLVHVLNVHEVWVSYICQGRSSDAELERLFQEEARHPTTWAGFRRYERTVWAGVRRDLGALTPARLRRPVQVFWMSGRYTFSDGLWQSTIEQAHHLGEVIGALWQDDLEPPRMTWIDVNESRR